MLNTIKDTTKHVYWNSRERCYVALMAETPSCRAEGSSPGEALANVDRAYARYEEPFRAGRREAARSAVGCAVV